MRGAVPKKSMSTMAAPALALLFTINPYERDWALPFLLSALLALCADARHRGSLATQRYFLLLLFLPVVLRATLGKTKQKHPFSSPFATSLRPPHSHALAFSD